MESEEEGGKPYYYNVETQESSWEPPAEFAWTVLMHESGEFWHNPVTGETQWDIPEVKAWTRQHDEF